MSIKITDTTLRDAHQSLIATRMRTRDMLDIATELDSIGFYSLEMWGGATFDTSIRFLNEDPWDRLKEIRKRVKNTRLQMLLRGQNLVGYRHYADDTAREFIRLAVNNGMDIFRIFDALNDIRNMKLSIETAKEYGAQVQGAICYTTSPVHTINLFVHMAVELEKLGCDSLCIKDMAGLISPEAARELVTAIKQKVKIPLDLHSHCTSGMAPISYYAAAMAGVDILDTAFSAFAWGTSQPPVESMVASLKGTAGDTGLNLSLLNNISEHFIEIGKRYNLLFTAEATRPNTAVLLHQIPGGMISNLVSQLREQKALDKLNDVLAEVPRVRADLGYPPLVTPTSQVVGTQAVLNVLSGERYKQVTRETKNYLMGYYGTVTGKIDPAVKKAIIGDEEPITVRPADLIPPEMEKARNEAQKLGIIKKEEDVITYALYPEVAVKFLRGELKEEVLVSNQASQASQTPVNSLPAEFSVDVDGEVFNVKVSPVKGEISETAKTSKPAYGQEGAIAAPMNGMILSIRVKAGDKVNKGDVVATIEAMKMASEICTPRAGIVTKVLAYEGELVNAKDVIMIIGSDNDQ
jgi:pyruvate carboxylase subunit B